MRGGHKNMNIIDKYQASRKEHGDGETRNEEHGLNKFIVPIKKHSFNNEEIVREVIIQTETPERARIIAIGDFQHDGWFVDMDCENYKQLKG